MRLTRKTVQNTAVLDYKNLPKINKMKEMMNEMYAKTLKYKL
jgi:hypothetical protein